LLAISLRRKNKIQLLANGIPRPVRRFATEATTPGITVPADWF